MCADLSLAARVLWVHQHRKRPAAARAGRGTHTAHAVSVRAAYMHAAGRSTYAASFGHLLLHATLCA